MTSGVGEEESHRAGNRAERVWEAGRGGLGTRKATGQKGKKSSEASSGEGRQGLGGIERGPQVHRRQGRSRSLPGPGLLHDSGALLALSGCRSPRGGRSPGRCQALPRSLQRKKPESLPPPQLLLAPVPGEGTRSLSCFLKRASRSASAAPSANGVFWVQGRDCSREVAGRRCRRRAQAAGAHAPRLRRDWLARADPHQLSCQPRVSGGGAPSSPGPAQVTRRGTHPPASTASLEGQED